ncbi:transporter substrate-binding protein [Aminobacter sp. BA135]|uniref:transporter substrate-binding protein n=1 Tax=Aminobacter sp. BA135 TaxID=537596 RepID=UPI003D795163
MKSRIEIGVLYSRSGSYQLVANACHAGAMRAISDVNADPASGIELVAIERDPAGNIDRYAPLCDEILRQSSARHVVGAVTSWSRKEVIPVLEKSGAALWYACPYEGFEANEHVVYMHACPNQHLVPLLAHVVPRFGADGFLLGSNYIWGWETNRVARDLIADAGGKVLGERYLPIGDADVSRLIEEIKATRPSFILNNLIGTSSYAFFAAYAELARRDPHFGPERCPILSCNLTEAELPAIGAAGSGHLSVGPYFRDAGTATPEAPASSFEASAYASVMVLAKVLQANPDAGFAELSTAFANSNFATPFGSIAIDPQTQHATLPVEIGRILGLGFERVSHIERVAPDPYLSRYDRAKTFGRARLKVVS